MKLRIQVKVKSEFKMGAILTVIKLIDNYST